MPAALLSFLLNPKALAAAAVVALLVVGYVHYRGLISDLETARADLVAARADAALAISAAATNAEQAAKADQDRRRVVAELEAAQAELQSLKDSSHAEEEKILTAPETADGPVAPLLEDWRKRRYGGGQ
jgi:hypothetical protein